MSSKFLNTATAIALIAAPAAWAGSLSVAPSEPEMAPMVAPVDAPFDWSGFYAGLSAGKTTGDFDITVTDPPAFSRNDLDGRSFGGFAGYNWQRGSLVYGLELALQDVDADLELNGEPRPDDHFNYLHDLKARIGFANDNMLFYAFGGYSMGEFEIAAGKVDANGSNFRENRLVGLEYIRRSLDGDFNPVLDGPEHTFDSKVDTIQLRVGYKF